MASKRSLRRKQCGKTAYPTELAATDAMYSLIRHKGGQRLNVYRCQFGEHFHYGHPPARVRQSINAKRRSTT